jgi:hypothetical protein
MYEVYLEFSAGIDRQNGIAIAEISNQIADSAVSLCWLYLVTLFGALWKSHPLIPIACPICLRISIKVCQSRVDMRIGVLLSIWMSIHIL